MGRFLTPDPYQGSANPANPQSWNRYSYVNNDPINKNDPSWLNFQLVLDGIVYGDYGGDSGWFFGSGGGGLILPFGHRLGRTEITEAIWDH